MLDRQRNADPLAGANAPDPVRLREVPAGAETVVSEHAAAMLAPRSPKRYFFWVNLVALLGLSLAGTFWFQQHLQPYFTEIVLIGGSLSLWAALRLLWGVAEKATGFDAWDRSRKMLSSAELTRLLAVAIVALAVLWPTTTSLYFEYGGKGSGDADFLLEVVRTSDRTNFIEPLTISSTTKVVGRPFFWQRAIEPLECRIARPVGFEPLDCSIGGARAVRLKVPGSFAAQELHLLRLVPSGRTYTELPPTEGAAAARYRLEITIDGQRHVLDDIRRQTIYLGGTGERMPQALRLESPAEYPAFLVRSLRAANFDEDSATQMAAVLSASPRTWDVLQARAGQKIGIVLRWSRDEAGASQSGMLPGFPFTYTITADKVQTVWLPSS